MLIIRIIAMAVVYYRGWRRVGIAGIVGSYRLRRDMRECDRLLNQGHAALDRGDRVEAERLVALTQMLVRRHFVEGVAA